MTEIIKSHQLGLILIGNMFTLAFLFSAQDVFSYLNHRRYTNLDLSVFVSFFEIYNGKVGRILLPQCCTLVKHCITPFNHNILLHRCTTC